LILRDIKNMGIFPYTCEKCGGSYKRCGYDKCENKDCFGSQFCYEDNVIILVINIFI